MACFNEIFLACFDGILLACFNGILLACFNGILKNGLYRFFSQEQWSGTLGGSSVGQLLGDTVQAQ